MFNREFISASSAVGFGALIGGLLSIEIATHFLLGNFLWIFGAIFGGCVDFHARQLGKTLAQSLVLARLGVYDGTGNVHDTAFHG